jgi:AcrR family transcriptional regulator
VKHPRQGSRKVSTTRRSKEGGSAAAPAPRPTLGSIPAADERGASARTRRLLLQTAMEIVTRGHVPSVSEVAESAQVSRATAYRYFPTQSRLIATITDYSLGPVRSWTSSSQDGVERLHELFDKTYPRFKEFEPQMRAALQLALEHDALDRAGLLKEEPYRRGFRRAILLNAAKPLEPVLGKARFRRLILALSLVYGIEPYVVLKDIWGLESRDVEGISRWMADAVIAASLAEIGKEAPPVASVVRRRRAKAKKNPS